MLRKIGVDIGRVIITGDTDEPNQFFGENYLHTPQVEGAFESIRYLVERYDVHNVFLVSKCSLPTEKRTLNWLAYHSFFDKTNIRKEHVFFCRERIGKKAICEENEISCFIDDRFSVLKHLININAFEKAILFSPNKEELELFNNSNRNKVQLVGYYGRTMPPKTA